MHPEQQFLIEGVVRRATLRRLAGGNDAANLLVATLHAFERRARLRTLVEHDRPHGAHGAVKPGERILLKTAVLGDTGGDFRMRELHQQRPPTGEQQNHLAVDLPDLAVTLEESISVVWRSVHGENAHAIGLPGNAMARISSVARWTPGKIHHTKHPNVSSPTPQIR